MNLKRLKTKAARMAAYAARQKKKEKPPEFTSPRIKPDYLPVCVGLQVLADVWGGKVRNQENKP